jgi:hypothetical protein
LAADRVAQPSADRPNRLDDAHPREEADATRLSREWVLAHVTRCRGLAAAARGDVEQALALLDRAAARA